MNCRVKKKDSYVRFWLLLTLLSAMIFVRYGLQINIPRILLLFPVVAIALLGNQTEIMSICMCLIPLHESLDFYYAVVITIIIYVFKYYRRIKINLSIIMVLFMVLWELLHCFAVDFSSVTLVVSLAPIIALAIIMCSDLSDLDYAFMVRAVAVVAISVCVTMLVQVAWLAKFNLATILVNFRRLGAMDEASWDSLRVSGGMIQTNSLGIICVIITSSLLQLRSAAQSKRVDILLMVILLIFGTLTASRTFLACLALMIVLMLLGQRGGTRKLRFLAMAVLMGIVVVLIFGIFFQKHLEYYISRFLEADITTGRDDLMYAYHRFIIENPNVMFFGIGLQNYGTKLTNIYRISPNIPHNSVQEIVIAWGIPGLLLIMLLILLIIHQSKEHTSTRKLMNYIPLIILLFKSAAGQLLTSGYTILALSFAYLSLAQDFSMRNISSKG